MERISVFVIDDHELLRLGIREAVALEPDIEIVGEAGGAAGTADRIAESNADVAILDVRLSDGSGIELCRDVLGKSSHVRCLIYTSATGDGPLYESILAGAAGYLLKDSRSADLIHAIRAVAAGESLIDPVKTKDLLARVRDAADEPSARLTEQEQTVLELIGEGLTNKEIAERLHLADQTVKNYVSRVLTKLGMGRTRAAVYAARLKRPEKDDH